MTLREEVRAFLAEGGFEPSVNAWMDGHDRAFTQRLGARGWIGMTWPERYGGGGRSALERHVVTEELLAAGAPVAAHWFADRQVGPQLLRFGNEDQRERFLPAIARGECCFAIGMSEPDAGSDLAAVRTRAVRDRGGWRVSGTKVWTSHAHASDFMIALCRTSPRGESRHEGLSQLIVELGGEGVEVRPIEGLDGRAHFCEVILDDAFVADELVVGAVGQGWAQVTAELAYERSGPERFLSVLPLLSAAVDQAAPDDAERVGRAYAALVALRRLSLDVVGQLQAGVAPEVEAALVKDLGTRFEQDLVEALRQVARDDRFRSEVAAAQLAAPGFTLRGGTTEILRGIIGRAVTR
jgi:alkylation response protein AidB-like acyl-CoA dehydrogenase